MQSVYLKISRILCFAILFTACQKNEIKRLDLNEQLQAKYQKFIDDKVNSCKQKAIEEAAVAVDSMIDQILSDDLIDTIQFPIKPTRPEKRFDKI